MNPTNPLPLGSYPQPPLDKEGKQNEVEESLLLPPLKLDQLPPFKALPPTTLPNIQTLQNQLNLPNLTKELTGTSPLLNQLQVSAVKQSKFTFHLKTWLKTFKVNLPSFRFYFNRLDSNTIRELSYDLTRLGAGIEHEFNDKVTHIIFLPTTLEPTINFTNQSTVNPIDNNILLKLTTSIPPTRYVSPFPPTNYNNPFLNQSGKYELPPVKLTPQEPPPINAGFLPPAKSIVKPDHHYIRLWPLEPIPIHQPRPLYHIPAISRGFMENPSPHPQHHIHAHVHPRAHHNTHLNIPSLGVINYDRPIWKKSDIHFFKFPYVLVEDKTGHHRPAVAAEYPPAKDPNEVPWPRLYSVPANRCPFIRVSSRKKGHESKRKQLEANAHKVYAPVYNPKLIGSHAALTSNTYVSNIELNQQGKKRAHEPELLDPILLEYNRLAKVPDSQLYTERPVLLLDKGPEITRPLTIKMSAAPAPSNAKKPGYCENCRVKYNCIEEHIRSDTHRNFAKNEAHFIAIDKLLARIARQPNQLLATMTTPSSSSPNHWLMRSQRDYSENMAEPATVAYSQPYNQDLPPRGHYAEPYGLDPVEPAPCQGPYV